MTTSGTRARVRPTNDTPAERVPAEMTPHLVTDLLRHSGVLAESRQVTSVTPGPMAGGYLSETVRLTLTYDRPAPGAPPSLIGKFPARDEQTRGIASFLGMYRREVLFYRHVGPTLDMRIPDCHLGAWDDDSGSFALLLQDVRGATTHDQDLGCDESDSRLALRQVARLHAAYWDDPALTDLLWLNHLSPVEARAWQDLYRFAWQAFISRDGVSIDPAVAALWHRLAASDFTRWICRLSGPLTLAHTDFHLGNVLFAPGRRGRREAVTVDWQMAAQAPALLDVSYFLGRLPTAVRRRTEEDLVRYYHGCLVKAGVANYPWRQCWADYQRWTWFGVLSAVAASAAYPMTADEVPRYTRKVVRFLLQAQDHGAVRFLD